MNCWWQKGHALSFWAGKGLEEPLTELSALELGVPTWSGMVGVALGGEMGRGYLICGKYGIVSG